MARYHVLKRPSRAWVLQWIGGAVVAVGLVWVIGWRWPTVHDLAAMLLSTAGALVLLYAAWSSIKLRERLCLLALASDRDTDPDLAEALEDIDRATNREMLDSLEMEWKCNIAGVILLVAAVAAYLSRFP